MSGTDSGLGKGFPKDPVDGATGGKTETTPTEGTGPLRTVTEREDPGGSFHKTVEREKTKITEQLFPETSLTQPDARNPQETQTQSRYRGGVPGEVDSRTRERHIDRPPTRVDRNGVSGEWCRVIW